MKCRNSRRQPISRVGAPRPRGRHPCLREARGCPDRTRRKHRRRWLAAPRTCSKCQIRTPGRSLPPKRSHPCIWEQSTRPTRDLAPATGDHFPRSWRIAPAPDPLHGTHACRHPPRKPKPTPEAASPVVSGRALGMFCCSRTSLVAHVPRWMRSGHTRSARGSLSPGGLPVAPRSRGGACRVR